MGRSGSIVAVAAVGVLALVASAQSTYSFVGSIAAPAGSWTVGADGRIWALSGSTVRRQTAINASTYEIVGTLDASGGRLSISPDGTRLVTTQGSTLRAANIASLSTSATTATTLTTLAGTTGPNSVGAWYNNQFFVGVSSPASGPGFSGVVRLNFDSGLAPASTFALTISWQSNARPSGPVAIGGGNLFWATQYFNGADPDALLRYPIANVLGNTIPGDQGSLISSSHLTATGLAVDGFGSVILDAGNGFQPTVRALTPTGGVLRSWFSDFPSGFTPPYLANTALPTFNPVTFELLALAPNGSISRFSIPSPTAAGLLGLGALAACRRRR